ncbi:hypothetical protein Taro_007071 [Colocasia esculenta]|uniref:Uncharacterized protein n=1 Tax=Colocasia esculenta TaxID=4460 RepID=A0A843TUG6_COLES|nr:hypothetical protein [Colocasia esculenta]
MIDGGRNDQRISVWGRNPYKVFVREGYNLLGRCACRTGGIWSRPRCRRRPIHNVHSPCVIASASSAFSARVEASRDHIDLLPVGLVVDWLHGSPLSASGAVFILAHEPSKVAALDKVFNLVLKLVALGGVVAVVTMKATVLVLVALPGVRAHPLWPLNVCFVPDLRQDLFGCHRKRCIVGEGARTARRVTVASSFLPITVRAIVGRPLLVRLLPLLCSTRC